MAVHPAVVRVHHLLQQPALQALKGQSLLHLQALPPASLAALLQLAAQLKVLRQQGVAYAPLQGKSMALYFQQPSLRTRVSFELAATELGLHCAVLRQEEVGLGQREAVEDVARTLGRYVHLIAIRHLEDDLLEGLAQQSGVPVINALSRNHHPCQTLADLQTLAEHWGGFNGQPLCFMGDAANNVARSLMQGCALLGLPMVLCAPAAHAPTAAMLSEARALAQAAGSAATFVWEPNPSKALAGCAAVYTDVFTSMGQEAEKAERLAALMPYQLNESLLAHALPTALVLHCLPAHRGEEIDAPTLERHATTVFDQAENRLHAQKALMLALLNPLAAPKEAA